MPIVELQTGTYDHDDYGQVAYPVFHIIDWAYWDVPRSLSRSLQPPQWLHNELAHLVWHADF